MRFRSFCLILTPLLLLSALPAFAQLGAATTEDVFGGRVNWIDAVDTGAMTRVFIATESANSMFWTDVNPTDATTVMGSYGFTTVSAFDINDGFGTTINRFAGHGTSGWVYVIAGGAFYGTDPSTTARTTIESVGVWAVYIIDDNLFYVLQGGGGGLTLEGGTLDGAGAFTSSGAGLDLSACGFTTAPNRILVNPVDNKVYLFQESSSGGAPTLCKSSDAYTAFTGSTTFSALSTASVTTETDQTFSAFGIGPDGRVFIGRTTGSAPGNKYLSYTDDDGTNWTNFDTGVNGVAGANIATAGSAGAYDVYFGTGVSTSKGASATWSVMPTVGGVGQPHANDGATVADPNNSSVVYLTTDVAFGMTPDQGQNLVDLYEGIVAVQVKDFDMDATKTYGWLASKAGIFHVEDYNTGSEAWSHSFPTGDGSPYYSIAMDPSDLTGQTAYAANLRIYKTTTGGAGWSQLFSTEDSGYHGGQFDFFSYIDALAVHPSDVNVVFAGIRSPSSGIRGGIFYTTDGGTNWTQVSTVDGPTTYNAEVTDLLLVPGTGTDATVYVASEYVSDGLTSAYGVKTIDYVAGVGTTYDNVMDSALGHITNFGAYDLATNAGDGSVWACGANSSGDPRVYRLASGATQWEQMPTAGLPSSGICTAITIGEEADADKIPYIAVGEQIYYNANNTGVDDETTGGWAADPALAYPVGTEINVLFWDELLVGTGAGFYGHTGSAPLPVELAGFEAVLDGHAALLTWRTHAEANNAGFEVQVGCLEAGASKIADEAWDVLSFVEGQGTTTIPHTYAYRTSELLPGNYRFRLRQVDFDGQFDYSHELEVTVGLEDEYMLSEAYPNPFNPQTTVQLAVQVTQAVQVAVYDVLGRRVALLHDGLLAADRTHTFHFDGADLSSGLYLVRAAGVRFTETRKVLLMK